MQYTILLVFSRDFIWVPYLYTYDNVLVICFYKNTYQLMIVPQLVVFLKQT